MRINVNLKGYGIRSIKACQGRPASYISHADLQIDNEMRHELTADLEPGAASLTLLPALRAETPRCLKMCFLVVFIDIPICIFQLFWISINSRTNCRTPEIAP